MSNQACPGMPVAVIGEVGVPSVSGGYGAADTFSDDTEKQFLEKSDRLRENFQNFATKGFTWTLIHVFFTSFAEIGEAEVTKRVRFSHHENGWYFSLSSF